jgi:uncharacterized protein
VKLLIEAGVDIIAKSVGPGGHDKRPVLLLAAESTCCAEAALVLLRAGADLFGRSVQQGLTALHLAAKAGLAETCELLLAQADELLEARDVGGNTALMHAAYSGRLDVLQFLLNGGADVNAASNNGTTALSAAARQQRVDTVLCLLKAGANVNHADGASGGHSALMESVQQNNSNSL